MPIFQNIFDKFWFLLSLAILGFAYILTKYLFKPDFVAKNVNVLVLRKNYVANLKAEPWQLAGFYVLILTFTCIVFADNVNFFFL
jgi:hypothetical protein